MSPRLALFAIDLPAVVNRLKAALARGETNLVQ
jgi:hypothetical protein